MKESISAEYRSRIDVLDSTLQRAVEDKEELSRKCGTLDGELKKYAEIDGRYREVERRVCELKNERDTLLLESKEKDQRILSYEGQVKTLKADLDNEQTNTEEKLRLLTESKEQLTASFRDLANTILDEKSKKFTEQNKTNIDQILSPLREQLSDFRKRVDDVYTSESKDREALAEKIRALSDLNQQVSRNADNLTKALKGENKIQGNWGEMVLERALELSGLKEGIEYDRQVTERDEEGNRQVPDVVVHLPEQRDIVIDSKVTLIAYERAVAAETDEERDLQLKAHVDSVRTHIKSLSAKSYDSLPGISSLDFVLLFMPIEAAFVAAIRKDPEVFEYAYAKRVILVSPSTLLVTLRTVQNMWRSEYQNRNAQDIAARAAALYDKFVTFADTLIDVKKAIGSASTKCDGALKLLSEGRGNIIRKIEEFRKLGVTPKKLLPGTMLEASDEE
ncbi:MAG: DNA recombination protein RmuC [Chitinispirillaceae bacterium]|nr:DNA recombination protein RmuC [Chitinispirillaceae bacterium]